MTDFIKIIESSGANINRIQQHLNDDCICFMNAFKLEWPEFKNIKDERVRKEKTLAKNREENKKLFSDIKSLQYGVIKIGGGYTYNNDKVAKEESFIIINNNIKRAKTEEEKIKLSQQFKGEMLSLCDKYNQETILIKYLNENGIYECGLMNKSGIIVDKLTNNITFEDLKAYWSTIHGKTFKIKEASFDFENENIEQYKGSYNSFSHMSLLLHHKDIEKRGFYKYEENKNDREN